MGGELAEVGDVFAIAVAIQEGAVRVWLGEKPAVKFGAVGGCELDVFVSELLGIPIAPIKRRDRVYELRFEEEHRKQDQQVDNEEWPNGSPHTVRA